MSLSDFRSLVAFPGFELNFNFRTSPQIPEGSNYSKYGNNRTNDFRQLPTGSELDATFILF